MLSVRNATCSDIPLIRELTFNTWPQTYSSIISKEQIDFMLEMMYSEASLTEQMNNGHQFVIINDTDEPMGFAAYQKIEHSLYKLHKIYILASQQGKGTGKFLINHIIHTIKQLGAVSLQLQVNRNNKAIDFYEKFGFKILKEADFDIGNGFFMKDYVMEKKM